jgi:7,8-dihydropterin-6-yl-methyl-4-(beta-D-ribofuranosyl)aminobenzene 5'-phosphate synthase
MTLLNRPINRRHVLVASAGVAIAAMSRGAWASASAMPTVDRLTLRILVDNASFGPFLPPQTLPGLKVQRRTGDAGPRMSADALHAEFGLSVLGISQVSTVERRVLMDFGYTAAALANNLALLGIDPERIDAAVLSHGHLDHYGGFAGLFARQSPRQRSVPLIVGGEEVFCERVALIGNPPLVMGTLDRAALARAGFTVKIAAEPLVVADQAFTSGIIPLRSKERAAIPTVMHPGKGCDKSGLAPEKRQAESVTDDGEHELALCYAVKDLGLVVISSCSHRGVLNAIRQAQAVSGIARVHAVVGGFHLVRPRTEDEARQTAAELAAIGPAYIVPMHCTGEVFIEEAMRLMPGKVVRPYVGTEFVFEA